MAKMIVEVVIDGQISNCTYDSLYGNLSRQNIL